jgi:hypothetical protein
MPTIILIGPVGWFFVDINTQYYDRLPFIFISSLILTTVTTFLWKNYFDERREEDSD